VEKVISFGLGENFICRLADLVGEYFVKQGLPLERLALVFGGKRPALFLKKELALRLGDAYFPPRCYSMDEFVETIVSARENFTLLPELEAYFRIYILTKKTKPRLLKGRESFSSFLPWAREIFSFIEQLDFEDISAESLVNIGAHAKIGYDVPGEVNLLLQDIADIRRGYHRSLKEDRTYTRGFLYLLASDYIGKIDFRDWDRIIFCGPFYLHATEKKIIKNIYDRDKASLVFQGDQDDWTVLRELSEQFSVAIRGSGNNQKSKPHLYFYRGFDTHSQISLARQILKKIGNPENTVIVLPEAEVLVPLLSEISAVVKEYNVSLGYPLKRSALYSLFEDIFHTQLSRKENSYYTKDYLRILAHPFIKNLRIIDSSVSRVLVHKIEEVLLGLEETDLGGSLFVKLKDIEDLKAVSESTKTTLSSMGIKVSVKEVLQTLSELHRLVFGIWQDITDFRDFGRTLERLMYVLIEKSFLERYAMNLKVAERIVSFAEELEHAGFSREKFTRDEIFKIFLDKLGNEIFSFSGSPLKGLQVLGLLETRILSFENVVVMDMNESVLPRLRIYEPFIPRDVMVTLGIDRLEKEEQIQHYQFLRLVSSARNVHLIYKEDRECERSRFIEELIWKMEQEAGEVNVARLPLANFSLKVLPKKPRAGKNTQMIKFLKEKEYSASSINMYVGCPLKFYYHYVLGLEEKEDIFEEPENVDVGNFLHKLLEETYKVFLSKKFRIDEKFIKHFFLVFEEMFGRYFARRMKSDAFMLEKILRFRMEQFLNHEEERRDVNRLLSVERDFSVIVNTDSLNFRFICKVDRIDELSDGGLLITDYKTGSIDQMPRNSPEKTEFSRRQIKETVKSFQLPLYIYCLADKFKDKEINAAFYNLRTSEFHYFPGKREASNKEAVFNLCMEALRFILKEIVDPEVDFVADNTDFRLCQGCPYLYLCR
jgi:hypothetical protein